jgi:replication factor A1
VWNVSFTENTITTRIVSFQVNSIVAQLDGDNALSVTPVGSQSSSLMLSKDASNSMQNTPLEKFQQYSPFATSYLRS